jgi:hypothetical protein
VKILVYLFLLTAAWPAAGAPALFPKPLHLVKRIDDPLAKKPVTVDEYCYGDRIVSISGDRVTVIDYAAQTVTSIDHAASTWSVTRFDEIANARPKSSGVKAAEASAAKVTPAGMKSSAGGRSVETYDIEAAQTRVSIGFDRSIAISRGAVEALIGAAYPNAHRPEHDAILSVAGRGGKQSRMASSSEKSEPVAEYGLPSEQSITIDSDGESVTLKTSVLRVDGDLPPQRATLIDPGATRIESPIERFNREMHDADTIPEAAPKQ